MSFFLSFSLSSSLFPLLLSPPVPSSFSLLDMNLSYWHISPSSSTISAAKTRPVIAEPEIHGSQSLDSVTGFLLLMSEGLINALESAHGPEQANQVRGFILTASTTFPLLVFLSSFYNLCINVSPPSLANHLKTTHFISLFLLIPSCPVPPFLLMPLLFILSIDIIFVFIVIAPSWTPRPVFLDHFWSEFPLLLSFAPLLYLFLLSYWASCSSLFFSYLSSFFWFLNYSNNKKE